MARRLPSLPYPRCDEHKDCFANKEGKCICLKDNDFGERDCPFYKSEGTADTATVRV